MLRLFKLFKFTRMHKLSAYLEYFEVIIRFNPGLLRIFRLLIVIILSCHLFGCVWWWVGTEEMAARIREGYNVPPHGIEERWRVSLEENDQLRATAWDIEENLGASNVAQALDLLPSQVRS